MVGLLPEYRNITVSGLAGSGTTTLVKGLYGVLGDTWELVEAGPFFRKIYRQMGWDISDSEQRPEELDRMVDEATVAMLLTGYRIIREGWLTGWLASSHQIPGVLKVLLVCGWSKRTARIASRDGLSRQLARKRTRRRENGNRVLWRDMYGVKNYWFPEYYDKVVDTGKNNIDQTLMIILRALSDELID